MDLTSCSASLSQALSFTNTRIDCFRFLARSNSSSITSLSECARQPPRSPITRMKMSELSTASRHALREDVLKDGESSFTRTGIPPAREIASLAARRNVSKPSITELTKTRGAGLFNSCLQPPDRPDQAYP